MNRAAAYGFLALPSIIGTNVLIENNKSTSPIADYCYVAFLILMATSFTSMVTLAIYKGKLQDIMHEPSTKKKMLIADTIKSFKTKMDTALIIFCVFIPHAIISLFYTIKNYDIGCTAGQTKIQDPLKRIACLTLTRLFLAPEALLLIVVATVWYRNNQECKELKEIDRSLLEGAEPLEDSDDARTPLI